MVSIPVTVVFVLIALIAGALIERRYGVRILSLVAGEIVKVHNTIERTEERLSQDVGRVRNSVIATRIRLESIPQTVKTAAIQQAEKAIGEAVTVAERAVDSVEKKL